MEEKVYQIRNEEFRRINFRNFTEEYNNPNPVMYWMPRREEIQRFIEIAGAVHEGEGRPKILDVGCGNGFLAYLLAITLEVEVIGMDPNGLLFQNTSYVHENLSLEVGNSQDAVRKYKNKNLDMVINSWMPGGINLTPDIRDIGAKTIAYIIESGGSTGIDYIQFKSINEWREKEGKRSTMCWGGRNSTMC